MIINHQHQHVLIYFSVVIKHSCSYLLSTRDYFQKLSHPKIQRPVDGRVCMRQNCQYLQPGHYFYFMFKHLQHRILFSFMFQCFLINVYSLFKILEVKCIHVHLMEHYATPKKNIVGLYYALKREARLNEGRKYTCNVMEKYSKCLNF